ncbi:anti-sigma factor family protein [Caldimonas sp. KR1-144]|uniref:anti-sigma factor family protein n=1 Tax=Caldimonas sp. KR1-144 TaxID=3400911 RepID=UPI003C04DB08
MNEKAAPPERHELHAWLDGELSSARAAEVEAWLAEHPQDAAEVAAWRAQGAGLRALHGELLDEPVPLSMQRALRPRRWAPPRGAVAAALLAGAALLVGFGSGWGLRSLTLPAPTLARAAPATPAFVREAAAAHVVYQPEKRHAVEVPAAQQEHLVQWLSKRLATPLSVPVLDAAGFTLVGGRLLPGANGEARGQFMYENGAGTRVTLYVSVLPSSSAAAPPAFDFAGDGRTNSFYWIDGRQGYALSGQLSRAELGALAQAVYAQLPSASAGSGR